MNNSSSDHTSDAPAETVPTSVTPVTFKRDPVFVLVSACIWLFIVFQILGIGWYWFFPETFYKFGHPSIMHLESVSATDQLNWPQRALSAGVSYLFIAVLIQALLALKKVAFNISEGEFFSRQTEKLTRRAGYLLLIFAPASTLRGALVSMITSWNNPEGERLLNISITNWDLVSIITGLILLLFARAIAYARHQREELSQIV